MATSPQVLTTLDLDEAVGDIANDVIVEVIQAGKSVRTTVGAMVKRSVANYAIATGASIDSVNQQTSILDNSTATAKTIVITGMPAGRAMTYVVEINGNAGVLSWPAGIVWDKSTQPKPGAIRTLVVLFWDGTGFTGAQGATA